MKYLSLIVIASMVSTACAAATPAGEPRLSKPGQYSGYTRARYDGYRLTSQYVAVRDGTRLAVDVFLPTQGGKLAGGKLPVVWMHTPYNRRTTNNGLTAANYAGKALQLVKYGYAVGVADFRGLYASYGRNAGYNRGEWQEAAKYDAYDITEWLARQPWSNGKVGMWGCSATGGSQMQALSTAPPSLKAIFPMSCEWDVYGFVAPGGVAPQDAPTMMMRGGSREERDRNAVAVDGDTGGKLMSAAIAGHADNLETAGIVPFRDSVSKEFGSAWWLQSSPHNYAEAINRSGIAVYSALNWAEGFTGHGPPYTFNNLRTPKKLILGPGRHCDWATVLTDTGFDIVTEELRFFDFWLRGIDNGVMREPAVTYYTYNAAPENAWKSSKTWPLTSEKRSVFYLAPGALATSKPSSADGATRMQVRYDTDAEAFWSTGMSFATEPLPKDTEVTGHASARLWLASTASDADIIARLDDLAPDGTHRYVGVEGKLRVSLRATANAPYQTMGLPWHPFTAASAQPLQPGVPVEAQFEFLPTSYIFKTGHRIRLTLQFADARSTPKLAPAPEVTVLHKSDAASFIELPVIPAPADEKYTFVIVHGATAGGWEWKRAGRFLSDDGHTVYRATLTGLGEREHLNGPDIDLQTHINDVVNLILYEDLHDVVLVGHSYGGMVITGVMDRIPDRIRHVTFLDAAVPGDGMSLWDLFGGGTGLPPNAFADGFMQVPWVKPGTPPPHSVKHSIKCFNQPVSYKNPDALALPVTYVAFIPKDKSAEERARTDKSWQRAAARGWTIRTFPGGHVAHQEDPRGVATLLEGSVQDRNTPAAKPAN